MTERGGHLTAALERIDRAGQQRRQLPPDVRDRIRHRNLDAAARRAALDPDTSALRRVRLASKPRLSIVDLATLSGLGWSTIYRMETAGRGSARSWRRVADALGVPEESIRP